MIEPLTGAFSPNGKDGRDGLELYMESINNTVAGRKIEISEADTTGDAGVALTKTKQLVEGAGVQLLTGFVATPECYAVAGYVQQAHIPMMVMTDCAAQDLTTNPKYASPYLSRWSTVSITEGDVAADYAYGAGLRKAIVMTADYAPGLQVGDLFASAFIARGGTVVQEVHAPPGTTDFGPYLAQLNADADVMALFEVGVDPLRFGSQYPDYAGGRKLQLIDMAGVMAGAALGQLNTKILNLISIANFNASNPNPQLQAFQKAFAAKYPGRDVSEEALNGWNNGFVIEAAIKKVNGNVEDRQALLNAINSISIDGPKGHISLDDHHDVVQDKYVVQVVKDNPIVNGVGLKLLKTYNNVGQFWDRTPDQLAKFNAGSMKGQWVGMTKDKLGGVLSSPSS
ncbi:MAG: ABC transporter substrate-binding protein [Chloroflexi bacterium]|nr:ABC transporter substrate-binding protein [Chloroflexota bacterium]